MLIDTPTALVATESRTTVPLGLSFARDKALPKLAKGARGTGDDNECRHILLTVKNQAVHLLQFKDRRVVCSWPVSVKGDPTLRAVLHEGSGHVIVVVNSKTLLSFVITDGDVSKVPRETVCCVPPHPRARSVLTTAIRFPHSLRRRLWLCLRRKTCSGRS